MIRTNPLRVLRFHDQIKNAVENKKFVPIRVIIDPTNLCNYKCPWCEPVLYRTQSIMNQRHTLTLDVAKQVLQDISAIGCKTAHFTGGGEPMLHPQFGEIARYAKSLGLKVAIDCNGSQIAKWHDDLLCVDNIRISLNASNAKEYEIQTGGKGDFDAICDAVSALASEHERPEIGLAFVISDCNRESVAEFETVRAKVGADFVFTRDERGPKFGKRNFSRCYSCVTIPVVGATGDVQACCDRRDITFGNVYQQRFKDIWGSITHQGKARAIDPRLCQKCVDDSYNDAVERFIVNDEARSWIV